MLRFSFTCLCYFLTLLNQLDVGRFGSWATIVVILLVVFSGMYFEGSRGITALSRVYTRTHVAGYKLYPLVSTCRRRRVSCMSSVCRPSVAGYKGIGLQVDRNINE